MRTHLNMLDLFAKVYNSNHDKIGDMLDHKSYDLMDKLLNTFESKARNWQWTTPSQVEFKLLKYEIVFIF